MSFCKRLVIFFLALLVVGVLDAFFAPLIIARGIRFWIWWTAKEQGLSAEIERIDAPFLSPVTIRNLSVNPGKDGGRDISFRAASVVVDLNLRGWIFGGRASLLRSAHLNGVSGQVGLLRTTLAAAGPDWRLWARLLPDNFQINDLNLDLTTAATAVRLRGVSLTASAVESGRFFAHQILVTSPLLRQTFADLRGATSWESARLTIAGIPLARGLDLETLTIDLSRLTKRRLGIDLQLDTYGGTLRASLQGRAGEKFSIDLAGSASNISLAQISSAVGFLEPITGSVRASKFTFRGNPSEFLDATGSIWMEATDFAWRARQADSVMIGATYYNRRLEVDQLYVRQRQNELTVNGELLWPKKRTSWAQLPFRGRLNATITDLNGFAQFFGATTGDFSGALTAEGEINLVDPEASGRVAWRGRGVKFRGVALDSLAASLRLHGQEVTLENLEARHAEDFLRAEGTVELSAGHRFSGRLTGALNDLGVYAPLLPPAWRFEKIGGGATFDWRGDGTLAAHSGTVQFFAHGLQLPVTPLRIPLDVTLVGSYSPQDVFFRTFKLANDRFSLGGFLMLGSDFVELQSFELALDGTRRISGTLFLPFSLEHWRASRSLIASLDEEQKFDLDLALDRLDLGQLAGALGEKFAPMGILDGRLAAFGPLRALQVTTTLQVENLGRERTKNSIDFQGRLAEGRIDLDATAIFGISNPITGHASLPVRLEKKRLQAKAAFDREKPFSVSLDCPALFLETLPEEWRFGAKEGLVTGKIAWSGTLPAPTITGDADLIDARFQPPRPWAEVSGVDAHLRFRNTEAVIDPFSVMVDSTPIQLRGRVTADPPFFGFTLTPEQGAIELASRPDNGSDLSSILVLGKGGSGGGSHIKEAFARGSLWPPTVGTLTITRENEGALLPFQTTYFFRPRAADAKTLLLRCVPRENRAESEPGDLERRFAPGIERSR
jgi:hypothetical protein